jgi:chemotaxis regulatin CheY-phosphate phosphatase CheZ
MRRKNKSRPRQCEKIERRHAARTAEWQGLLRAYLPELPALVSDLAEAANQLESAVLEASNGFDGIRAQARAALGVQSQELEREIVRVVVALQFQDIVNQKITRAIETLTRLDADLGACLERRDPEARSNGAARGASCAFSYPSKKSERRRPSGRNGAVQRSEIEPRGDIEIFLPEVNS